MSEFTYSNQIFNVVVVGQSGVGKSSFLNYVADDDIFETGVGSAVTKGYFHKHKVTKGNVSYMLYDTEGLEPGKITEWESAILGEIEERDKSYDMSQWFHSLLFCVSAESKRIQPFEIEAIKRMSERGHVMVLFTKKDKVEPQILEDLKKELYNQVGDQIEVLSVCSVATKFRNGRISAREGLEDVLKMTFVGFWKKMSKMMPHALLSSVLQYEDGFLYSPDVPSIIAWAILNNNQNAVDPLNFWKYINVSQWNVSDKTVVHKEMFDKINNLNKNKWRIVLSGGDIKALGQISYKDALILPSSPSKAAWDWGLLRMGISKYLSRWDKTYISLRHNLNVLKSEHICENLESMIRICSRLYYQITGHSLNKPISLYDIKQSLERIKALDANISTLRQHLSSTISKIREVDNCILFSSSERDALIYTYGQFKDETDKFLLEYKESLSVAMKAISQELRSYADYTLR